MFKWIMNFVHMHHSFNDLFALFLFYIPMLFNGIAYTFRVMHRIDEDKKAFKHKNEFHRDWLRVKHVVGYAFLTILPVVNLIAFTFDTLGSVWDWVIKRFSKFFEIRFIGSDKN